MKRQLKIFAPNCEPTKQSQAKPLHPQSTKNPSHSKANSSDFTCKVPKYSSKHSLIHKIKPVPVLKLSGAATTASVKPESMNTTTRQKKHRKTNSESRPKMNYSLSFAKKKAFSKQQLSVRKQSNSLPKSAKKYLSHRMQADLKIPCTPASILKSHIKELTQFEHSEILSYKSVYFIGKHAKKIESCPKAPLNSGYDDERGDYNIVLGDHIRYRYEILSVLGSGSFGQVLKVLDHKTRKYVALKVIRNKNRFHQQALVEIKILKSLKSERPQVNSHIVEIEDYFLFRNHVCITFELLSINLYEFIKGNNFQGLALRLIKEFAVQLLRGLRFQHALSVIHCDLKPENILLKSAARPSIKIIDYGSSCFSHEKVYTYIQSRFYRAPEIMLGIEYTTKIDVWSLGCVLAELYTGIPLFPGDSEADQIACIMEVLGPPPNTLLALATRKPLFFEENNAPKPHTNLRGKVRVPSKKSLSGELTGADPCFIELIAQCLAWDPEQRVSAELALRSEWLQRLPEEGTAQGTGSARNSSLQPHQGHSKHQATLSLGSASLFAYIQGQRKARPAHSNYRHD